ncbi:MAG: SET domain-containing protein-lysine N-methyltransferase [Bacteroidetes bacterium]|nr:SET domain-containing protein-lysine N-methyltransferase [Bacteroidota bacterium]
MIHPSTRLQFISQAVGFGVVATERIPKGTVTWVQDPLDRVFSPDEIRTLPEAVLPGLDRFTFRNSEGDLVLCWDTARYMNHSCSPTCMGTDYGFELAVRDILPGEELSVDYASFHMAENDEFQCLCGAPGCRGFILQKDVTVLADQWSDQFLKACSAARSVPQPLLSLFPANRVPLFLEDPSFSWPAGLRSGTGS